MIEIRDKATGSVLGTLTEEQLKFLIDQLEEESPTDQDYHFNQETITMLAKRGADERLLSLLRKAIGDKKETEIVWSRT